MGRTIQHRVRHLAEEQHLARPAADAHDDKIVLAAAQLAGDLVFGRAASDDRVDRDYPRRTTGPRFKTVRARYGGGSNRSVQQRPLEQATALADAGGSAIDWRDAEGALLKVWQAATANGGSRAKATVRME